MFKTWRGKWRIAQEDSPVSYFCKTRKQNSYFKCLYNIRIILWFVDNQKKKNCPKFISCCVFKIQVLFYCTILVSSNLKFFQEITEMRGTRWKFESEVKMHGNTIPNIWSQTSMCWIWIRPIIPPWKKHRVKRSELIIEKKWQTIRFSLSFFKKKKMVVNCNYQLPDVIIIKHET